MEFDKTYIKITDETILQFYQNNPNLNFVTMNHILINILKSLSTELTDTMNTTINSQILSIVTDMHSNINSIKTDIIIKLHETKKEYIEDLKTILNSNSLSYNEKMTSLIEKNNDNLLTKTTLMINDIIPKNQEKNTSIIENYIKTFCSDITQQISRLAELTNKDEQHIHTIVSNIDTQFSKMINTIQQPIFTFIQSSEERTNSSIQNMKDNLNSQQHQQLKLTNEISDFLNKYKNNSSVKGSVSENELYYIIQSIMPTDEIVKVSSDTATCDIKVNRLDKTKPTILFENKEYNRSLTTEEVKKFERDVQLQKTHGIFISQKSPITYKNNFQIDIINGLIHLYIPNAEYDANKIKMAIDIIDSLSLRLETMNTTNDDEYHVSKDDMDDIIEEYRVFTSQKLQMIETIRTITKQLVDKMEDIQLPKLKKLFIKLGNIENDNDFKCTFCNSWTGKNKASLGAHIRNCKFNPKNKEIICEVVTNVEENTIIQPEIETQQPVVTIENEKPIATKKIRHKK
jgi:hypothetical protein